MCNHQSVGGGHNFVRDCDQLCVDLDCKASEAGFCCQAGLPCFQLGT